MCILQLAWNNYTIFLFVSFFHIIALDTTSPLAINKKGKQVCFSGGGSLF